MIQVHSPNHLGSQENHSPLLMIIHSHLVNHPPQLWIPVAVFLHSYHHPPHAWMLVVVILLPLADYWEHLVDSSYLAPLADVHHP